MPVVVWVVRIRPGSGQFSLRVVVIDQLNRVELRRSESVLVIILAVDSFDQHIDRYLHSAIGLEDIGFAVVRACLNFKPVHAPVCHDCLSFFFSRFSFLGKSIARK